MAGSGPDPLCFFCKYLNTDADGNSLRNGLYITCKAYPERIPRAFFPSGAEAPVPPLHDHRFPYKGDNDIQFELERDFEILSKRPYFKYYVDYFDTFEEAKDYIYDLFDRIIAVYDSLRQAGAFPEIPQEDWSDE